MKIEDILSKIKSPEAFILDHGKTNADGSLKYQDDLINYGYNVKRYNKLCPGALVLLRHPGKMTKDRKFEIFAGGIVESITEPDEDGNVIAKIGEVFILSNPITQGSDFIENYDWKTKKRIGGTWAHFWNQYGMNCFSKEDILNLLNGQNLISHDEMPEEDFTPAEIKTLENLDEALKDFKISIVDDNDHTVRKIPLKAPHIGKNIDYVARNARNNIIGWIGEEIAFFMLSEEARQKGLKEPEHVSKTRGNNYRYDILAFDKTGKEIHVEVKTSKGKNDDSFYISPNEVAASHETNILYKIYRIYELNFITKECKLKIYEGPLTEENCILEPTQYIFYAK